MCERERKRDGERETVREREREVLSNRSHLFLCNSVVQALPSISAALLQEDCFCKYLSAVGHNRAVTFISLSHKGEGISYTSDPLEDFVTIKFLDRFVYKNPKQKQSDHGGSAMQVWRPESVH